MTLITHAPLLRGFLYAHLGGNDIATMAKMAALAFHVYGIKPSAIDKNIAFEIALYRLSFRQ